jgi:hypothetical protein
MGPLRDQLTVVVREIRRDLHMSRRERTIDAQVPRARASLALERLIAQLDVERADEALTEARKGGVGVEFAEALVQRANEGVARAERHLHPDTPWCAKHRVSFLAGVCIGCRWNLPATPVDAAEIVPASEGVNAPSVPAAAAELVAVESGLGLQGVRS